MLGEKSRSLGAPEVCLDGEVSSSAENSFLPTGRQGSIVPKPYELTNSRKITLCTLQ
jgi:hypothetical protein